MADAAPLGRRDACHEARERVQSHRLRSHDLRVGGFTSGQMPERVVCRVKIPPTDAKWIPEFYPLGNACEYFIAVTPLRVRTREPRPRRFTGACVAVRR